MNNLRVTEKESVILAAVQLQANATASLISKETGIAEHLVRYSINKFENAGLLVRRAMLNPTCLGLVPYTLFFSVSYEGPAGEKQLMQTLVGSPLTASVYEVGGDFQFGTLLYSETVDEIYDFVSRLADLEGVTLIEKSIGIRISTNLLRRRYLSAHPSNVERIAIGRSNKVYVADELDHQILKGLTQTTPHSHRELARRLKTPHTTLDTRIRRLEEAGVIAGYIYGMDVQKLGLSVSRILFSTKGPPQQIWAQLNEFVKREPHVLQLTRSLGNWDYELLVETPTGKEVVEIIRRLHEGLGSSVVTVKTLPVYRYLKVNEYPCA